MRLEATPLQGGMYPACSGALLWGDLTAVGSVKPPGLCESSMNEPVPRGAGWHMKACEGPHTACADTLPVDTGPRC